MVLRRFTNADLFYTNVSERRNLDGFDFSTFKAPETNHRLNSILSKIFFLTYFSTGDQGSETPVLLIVDDVTPREMAALRAFFPFFSFVVYTERRYTKLPPGVTFRNVPLDQDLPFWSQHPSEVYLYSYNLDLESQKRWVLTLKPRHACLRVTLDGVYFDGYLLKQPWEEAFSSSTWLIPTKVNGTYLFRDYDATAFLEKIFFFQTKARVEYLYNNWAFEELAQVAGLTPKYDDIASLIILKMYLEKMSLGPSNLSEAVRLKGLLHDDRPKNNLSSLDGSSYLQGFSLGEDVYLGTENIEETQSPSSTVQSKRV